mgnify:CR=1 FL=1
MGESRRSVSAYLSVLSGTPLVLASLHCMTTDSCVAAGTRVATPLGWRAVETLRVGDAVYAVDVVGREVVETRVAMVRSSRRECLALGWEDGELIVTPDHPVFAPGCDGFVEAGRVALGQVREVLVVERPETSGRARVVEIGACRAYAGVHEVFDVGVAGSHATFVAEGLVVHNKSYDPSSTSYAPVSDSLGSAETSAAPTTSTAGTTGATDAGSSSSGAATGETTMGTESTGETGGVMFPCGDEMVCDAATEYCEVFSGGPDPTINYSCLPIPAACQDDPTCACLLEEGVGNECMPTPEGGLVVQVLGA